MQKCRSKTLAQTYLKSQTLYLILSLKLSLLVFTFQIIIFGHQNVFSGPFMIGELEKDFTLERFWQTPIALQKRFQEIMMT